MVISKFRSLWLMFSMLFGVSLSLVAATESIESEQSKDCKPTIYSILQKVITLPSDQQLPYFDKQIEQGLQNNAFKPINFFEIVYPCFNDGFMGTLHDKHIQQIIEILHKNKLIQLTDFEECCKMVEDFLSDQSLNLELKRYFCDIFLELIPDINPNDSIVNFENRYIGRLFLLFSSQDVIKYVNVDSFMYQKKMKEWKTAIEYWLMYDLENNESADLLTDAQKKLIVSTFMQLPFDKFMLFKPKNCAPGLSFLDFNSEFIESLMRETLIQLQNKGIPFEFLKKYMHGNDFLNQNSCIKDTYTQLLFKKLIDKSSCQNDYVKHIVSLILKVPFDGDAANVLGSCADYFDVINQLEYDFEKQGFITFVHGRRWEWNFFNDICLMLEEILLKKQVDKHKVIFRLRNIETSYFKKLYQWYQCCCALIKGLQYAPKNSVERLQKYREGLLKNGPTDGVCSGTHHKKQNAEIVFMNRSIFSNFYNYTGDCTGYYFTYNDSIADDGAALKFAKKMIKECGFADLINDQSLEKLYQLHAQSNTKTGELIMIAIRNQDVDKMVYPAKAAGYLIKNKKTSDSIADAKNRLEQDAEFVDDEGLIYCFAVPDMPSEYGVSYHTRSIAAKDPQKYQIYKQALAEFKKNLITRIESSRPILSYQIHEMIV